MRSRHVSLPRMRWRTTPGSSEPGRQPGGGQAAAARRRRRAPAATSPRGRAPTPSSWPTSAGATTATTASLVERVARLQVEEADDRATARRGHDGLHLHGADHEQAVAGAHEVADGDPDVDHGAAHRAAHRAAGPGRRRAPARVGAARGRRRRHRHRARRAARPARRCRSTSSGASASSVVRASPARTVGVGEDPEQLGAVGRQTGDVERRHGPAGAVDGVGDVGSHGGGDHLGQQRVELRRRGVADVPGGVDAHPGARRLLVGARARRRRWPSARACTAKPRTCDVVLAGRARGRRASPRRRCGTAPRPGRCR